jgi:hypothetical protein
MKLRARLFQFSYNFSALGWLDKTLANTKMNGEKLQLRCQGFDYSIIVISRFF